MIHIDQCLACTVFVAAFIARMREHLGRYSEFFQGPRVNWSGMGWRAVSLYSSVLLSATAVACITVPGWNILHLENSLGGSFPQKAVRIRAPRVQTCSRTEKQADGSIRTYNAYVCRNRIAAQMVHIPSHTSTCIQIVQPQMRTRAKTHKYSQIQNQAPHAHMPTALHQPSEIHPSIHAPFGFQRVRSLHRVTILY